MFSQKNAKIAGPPCKNYVVHLIICSRSQQPKLFFNGLAQWGWGFRGNSIVVVSGARAAINKASELLLSPPLRQYFVLPAPSTNMFLKKNKNRYTNAESQTWNRTLFLLHSQNNLYFCGRRVFIAQPEWYLRVLAVLLSSALTLVCPEEMASVANLHMSWMGKMLQNIFYFKLQIKCLEVEQLPLSPWQCQHIPPPQSGALILELTLRHIPQSNNYAIFPLCSNGAFYFKKRYCLLISGYIGNKWPLIDQQWFTSFKWYRQMFQVLPTETCPIWTRGLSRQAGTVQWKWISVLPVVNMPTNPQWDPTCLWTTLACLRMAMMSPTTVMPRSIMMSLLRSISMFFWILQQHKWKKKKILATFSGI